MSAITVSDGVKVKALVDSIKERVLQPLVKRLNALEYQADRPVVDQQSLADGIEKGLADVLLHNERVAVDQGVVLEAIKQLSASIAVMQPVNEVTVKPADAVVDFSGVVDAIESQGIALSESIEQLVKSFVKANADTMGAIERSNREMIATLAGLVKRMEKMERPTRLVVRHSDDGKVSEVERV